MSVKVIIFFQISSIFIFIKPSSSWPFFRRDVYDNGLDGSIGNLAYMKSNQIFGNPSNETGARVAGWSLSSSVNPEELGEYAEGDILFPPNFGRNGLKNGIARWPEGIIPYMMSPYFNAVQVAVIMDAMNEYHKHTCIRFIPYKGEQSDYVRITAGRTGCWSSVGRIGGRQDLNLQVPGCVTLKGTVIHELMHAVGFLHEQSRYERDHYVKINWKNIKKGYSSNFNKVEKDESDAFGVSYDYGSIMHYSKNAFSSNGAPTIEPTEDNGLLDFIGKIFQIKSITNLGQREGFSNRDIQKIQRMYKCYKRRRSYN
ncbi:zinc metalloproteinase nas-13-like isoform X1 [Aphidius gifuensis]|uniref:zinc metalloproteinase nas-13-like isoform X1 n=1 Tax=Aphidius gifuensis TaxID=684658 RepID=UPI001CDCA950|nr:zinc metalloproteinase nas-13-like isoform X1 [Aphidius gifuensis]